ncbi:MAG: ABC transporter ATP-binding protein, partial [Betaproteobacteria bacterium]|nr:ABC transporter ATP-binding protein [Betaproteobacteria bacterium]
MGSAIVADAAPLPATPERSQAPLLAVERLAVTIPGNAGPIHAVRDVSFSVRASERIAILGESGSGKTMTALSLLGLQPPTARVSGALIYKGRRIELGADPHAAAPVLADAGVIFQDSLSSLNPIVRVGNQLIERLTLRGWDKRAARAEAVRVLSHVGVADADARMNAYPHELSGGMRQRVMITMALLAQPALLVADEPTTALDTTVQAQVIDLIRMLQAENAMGLVLITHDLAMAAEVCDRAVVMYAGYVVEDLPMVELLRRPRHPYAAALLDSMPRLDSPADTPLEMIQGEPASALGHFAGCPFRPRCTYGEAACDGEVPPLQAVAPAQFTRCTQHERLMTREAA